MYAEEVKEKIQKIEEEILKTPYHKATEHHIGRLRARLAKLRNVLEAGPSGGGGGKQFAIKKTGDATVVLVGFPSVGKSTLLNKLTNAQSKTAAYPFSTVDVIPGMMDYQGAKIQIFDIPGLLSGAAEGKGHGRQVISAIRGSDLIILLAEIENPKSLEMIREELRKAGIRLDEKRPEIIIKKKIKGGLRIIKGHFDVPGNSTIMGVCEELGFVNGEVIIKEDIETEDLVDAFTRNRIYLPSLVVLNKIDSQSFEVLDRVRRLIPEAVFISAEKNVGLEELRVKIWQKLNLIRIYPSKDKNKAGVTHEPLILKRDSSVLEAAEKISLELSKVIDSALVWGKSVIFQGQKVGLSHKLEDGDVVYFVK